MAIVLRVMAVGTRSRLWAFSGIDGAGKTTQIDFLLCSSTKLLHSCEHLVVVDLALREHQFLKGLDHGWSAGQMKQIGNTGPELMCHHRDFGGCLRPEQNREDLAAVDPFVGGLDRARHLVLSVFDH